MVLSIEIRVPQAVIFDQGTEKKEEKMIRLEPRLPLDIRNGLSQVYCIKPEIRIHYLLYKE